MPDILCAHDFPPMGGGIARWMEAITRGYPPGELVVSTGSVAGSSVADAQLPQRIDRISTPSRRLRTVPGLARWAHRLSGLARQPDVGWIWCDTIRPAGYAARWAHARTGVPYGIMIVGDDLLTLEPKLVRSALRRRLMRSVLGRAVAFVAISEWAAVRCRAFLTRLQLEHAAARVHLVPLGTDPERWANDPAAAGAFVRRRNLPSGDWIVTVSRLVPYKGVDTVIRIVAALAPRHPALHYAVVGRGPQGDALRALARQFGVDDRVHFLDDVSDGELPSAYAMARVYVGLSRETARDVEGFGLSLVEAAACEVPVVAARSGGIPGTVEDGVTGVLVAANDEPAAATAIDTLLRDPALARRMGLAGRERVKRYFNWNRVIGDMRAIAAGGSAASRA